MSRRVSKDSCAHLGYTLVELVVATAVFMCFAMLGSYSLAAGLTAQSARGAAQVWQAASAWAQAGVMWRGADSAVFWDKGRIEVYQSACCGSNSLGQMASGVEVSSRPAAWDQGSRIGVVFSGSFASPQGGGSLYFHSRQGVYRVIVRPVSGLSLRQFAEDQQ